MIPQYIYYSYLLLSRLSIMSMICLIMPVSTGLDAGVHESIDLVIAPYVRSLFKVYINMYWFASFDSPSLSTPLCVIDMA